MSYLAIDPGIDTGWALFQDVDHLIGCGLGAPWDVFTLSSVSVRSVVIEKPKVYMARNMKGDPNDLITLAVQVGEYKRWASAEMHAVVNVVIPREWKGTEPKEINNARTLAELSEAERVIVKKAAYSIATSKQHNMLDAIGLGRASFKKRLWR